MSDEMYIIEQLVSTQEQLKSVIESQIRLLDSYEKFVNQVAECWGKQTDFNEQTLDTHRHFKQLIADLENRVQYLEKRDFTAEQFKNRMQ